MEYGVTIQIDGTDVFAGTLFANARRGRETSTALDSALQVGITTERG